MDFYVWLDHNGTSEGSIVLYYLCKVSKKYILLFPLIKFKSLSKFLKPIFLILKFSNANLLVKNL